MYPDTLKNVFLRSVKLKCLSQSGQLLNKFILVCCVLFGVDSPKLTAILPKTCF